MEQKIGKSANHLADRQLGGHPLAAARLERRARREAAKLARAAALEVKRREVAERRAARVAVAEARRQAIETRAQEVAKRKAALALRPLIADLHGLKLTNEVPATRADCPDTTKIVCGAVRCRYNLLRDEHPAGRPGLSNVPRDEQGHTIAAKGDLGKRSPPQIDARAWVSCSPRPSCALALADEAARRGEGMSNLEVAAALGKHRTLTARVIQRALRSFIAAGGSERALLELAEQEAARQVHRSTSDTPLLDRIQQLIPDNERNQENEP